MYRSMAYGVSFHLLLKRNNRITTITQCSTYWRILSMLECSTSGFVITVLMCRVDSSNVYFCQRSPITLSTWIRTWDNCRAVSTSTLLNWFFRLVSLPHNKVQKLPQHWSHGQLRLHLQVTSVRVSHSFRNLLVWSTPTPTFGHKWNCTLWCNSNWKFNSVVMLIIRPGQRSCIYGLWSFTKYLKTITNGHTLLEMRLKFNRHGQL